MTSTLASATSVGRGVMALESSALVMAIRVHGPVLPSGCIALCARLDPVPQWLPACASLPPKVKLHCNRRRQAECHFNSIK